MIPEIARLPDGSRIYEPRLVKQLSDHFKSLVMNEPKGHSSPSSNSEEFDYEAALERRRTTDNDPNRPIPGERRIDDSSENEIGLRPTLTKEQKAVDFVKHPLYDAICLLFMFAFFGITGSLIRIAINKLTAFEGAYYGGVLWSNFAGCLLMGMLIHNTHLFKGLLDDANERRRRLYHKKGEIPLYVALTTGACGSITSWSSFMLSLFELSTTQLSSATYPNKGYGVAVFLSYAITTAGVSFAGYYLGTHLSMAIERTFVIGLAKYELFFEVTLSTLGISFWIIVIVLSAVESTWRYWTLAMVFGPLGVYARYLSSRFLNGRIKTFPLGTFFANVMATILISIMMLLRNGNGPGGNGSITSGYTSCQVLSAVMDGFCGNFSTISSFVSELNGFKRMRYAYFYGLSTLAVSWACMVIILGSVSWTRGLHPTHCT